MWIGLLIVLIVAVLASLIATAAGTRRLHHRR
jgi:hypothetical protein